MIETIPPNHIIFLKLDLGINIEKTMRNVGAKNPPYLNTLCFLHLLPQGLFLFFPHII